MNNLNVSPLQLNSKAIAYTWQQLAKRIGIEKTLKADTGFESLNIDVFYAYPEQIKITKPSIIVIPASCKAWHNLLNCKENSLKQVPLTDILPKNTQLPFTDPVPVLFWGEGYEDASKPFAEQQENGTIVFYADIIAATFFMLSRWEEIVVPIRDHHQRFPATASVAYKQKFLERPIIDQYALILQAWLKILLPRLHTNPKQFSIKLSHDIDHVNYFANFYHATRIFARNLIKHQNLQQTQQTLKNLFTQITTPKQNPYFQGIYFLANISTKYKLNSAFYFMAANHSSMDSGYKFSQSLVKQSLEYLQQQGFEIGFHPGYYTFNNLECLLKEKARLDTVLGKTQYGGRQHYLRFQTPNTWQHWEEAGLTYDSTMGYADHEGFRCGTCHAFKPFDLHQNRELDLWELPLIVMDGTLCEYRGLTPLQGQQQILKLAQRCQQVNGTFTLLWHNTSLNGVWQPWVEKYKQVLEKLAQM